MAHINLFHHPDEEGQVTLSEAGGSVTISSWTRGGDLVHEFFPSMADLDTRLAAIAEARAKVRPGGGRVAVEYRLAPEPCAELAS